MGEGKIGTTVKGEQATERSCRAYTYHTSFKTYRHRASIQHQDEQGWNPHSTYARRRAFHKLIRLTVDFQRRFPNLDNHLRGEAAKFQEYREKLRPFLVEQGPLLRDAKAEGKNILVEGANGFMLDIGRCWILLGMDIEFITEQIRVRTLT